MSNNNNSPVTTIRLDPKDQKAVAFIQKELSAPGAKVNKSEALRRALHGFAELLRSKSDGVK